MNNCKNIGDPNLSSFCQNPTTDRCVTYTGPNIPALGIYTGDTLSTLEESIINELTSIATGEGIVLSEITGNCPFVTDSLIGKNKELATLIQILFDNQCSLKTLIDNLSNKIPSPFPFDLKCIPVPASMTTDAVLQSTINKVCEDSSKLEALIASIGGGSDNGDPDTDFQESIRNTVIEVLKTSLKSCQGGISVSGDIISIDGQVPIGTYLFGDWPSSSFDSTGKGLASAGLCGYALANGRNGTQDLRGWSIAGATNMPGPALLSQVNPGTNTDLVTNIGSRKGVYKYSLKKDETPPHTHDTTVNDPGHTHMYLRTLFAASGQNHLQQYIYPTSVWGEGSLEIDKGDSVKAGLMSHSTDNPPNDKIKTGISVKVLESGKGDAHENRPPTYYGTFIKRISSTPNTVIIGGGGGGGFVPS